MSIYMKDNETCFHFSNGWSLRAESEEGQTDAVDITVFRPSGDRVLFDHTYEGILKGVGIDELAQVLDMVQGFSPSISDSDASEKIDGIFWRTARPQFTGYQFKSGLEALAVRAGFAVAA